MKIERAFLGLLAATSAIAASAVSAGCSPAAADQTPAATPPAPQPAAPAPQSVGQRPGASGAITSVSGNVVTLADFLGGEARIHVGPATQIQKSVFGTVADMAPGQSVTVAGNTDAAGVISATSIVIRPAGQAGPPNGSGGFSGFGGAGRTQPGFPGATSNFSGQFAGRGRGVSGTVAVVKGGVMVLSTSQGDVTVNVAPETAIEKTVGGSLSDLVVGAFVTVTGPQDAAGDIDAATIQLRSAAGPRFGSQ